MLRDRGILAPRGTTWSLVDEAELPLPESVQSLVAALIYAGLFLLFAISRNERDWYFNKVKEVFKRSPVASAPTELSMPS